MVYGLFYTIVRLFHLYVKPRPFTQSSSLRHRLLLPWIIFCAILYLAHITYLSILPRFDYGWNMKANIVVGLTYNLLWMSYSLPNPPFRRFLDAPNSYRPNYILQPVILGILMICAACLEIFDFPPWWRVIDAHSLWHLATVPIIVGWYRFLLKDSMELSWRDRVLSWTSLNA